MKLVYRASKIFLARLFPISAIFEIISLLYIIYLYIISLLSQFRQVLIANMKSTRKVLQTESIRSAFLEFRTVGIN